VTPPASVSRRAPVVPSDGVASGWQSAGRRVGPLLDGPPAEAGPEPLRDHLDRLGLLPPVLPYAAVAVVRASGLTGRGGGEFPFAEKLAAAAAAAAAGSPVVVVNGCEGEPASRKDRTLLEHRPHLVLDGADFAAAACGAREVVVFLSPGRRRTWDAVAWALRERADAGLGAPLHRMVSGSGRYVDGESTAVVAALEGRPGLPRRRARPVAAQGAFGRPTVIGNVETLAHVGLLARFGPGWFRSAGSPSSPGSSLVTLAGAVVRPGTVVEVAGAVTFEELMGDAGWRAAPPQAVLVGGYSGRFVEGPALWSSAVDRGELRAAGIGLGCGVIAPVPHAACGLALTRRLLGYLAGQSAGQCGSCALGLPALVRDLDAVLAGRGGGSATRRLLRRALDLEGRGGCGHPDGAVALLASALHVFEGDAACHASGGSCGGDADAGWFPGAAGACGS
jgi:NADH:ubiquinone oxidoreductase subunit F (NADH-binding)